MEATLASSGSKWWSSWIKDLRCEHSEDFQNPAWHTYAHNANHFIELLLQSWLPKKDQVELCAHRFLGRKITSPSGNSKRNDIFHREQHKVRLLGASSKDYAPGGALEDCQSANPVPFKTAYVAFAQNPTWHVKDGWGFPWAQGEMSVLVWTK